MKYKTHDRPKTFEELFGLTKPSGLLDNPSKPRGRTARFSRESAGDVTSPSKAKRPKRGAKSGAGKRGAKPAAKRKPKRGAAKCGPRFSLRRIGSFTGIWDSQAGQGSGPRGRYVKRGDLECGSEKGASATLTLEVLQDMSLPASKMETRGPWQLWLDKSGNWLVYDKRTATLEERSFLQRAQALRYISSGRAQRDTCPPRGKGGKIKPREKDLKRRSNPGMGEIDNPSRAMARDEYLTGTVEGRGRHGGTVEGRLSRVESKVDQLDVRVTRVEGGLGRALDRLSGKTKRVGSGGRKAPRRLPAR